VAVPRPRVDLFTYHGVLAPAAAWRASVVPEPPADPDAGDASGAAEGEARNDASDPGRASRWARLMKRVFEIDVLVCDPFGGRRRIIAFVTETAVVQKILVHLGLPHEPPPIAPARSPPELPLFM